MQALDQADESQKRILLVSAILLLVFFTNIKALPEPLIYGRQENYGKSDPESVAKVKDLYKELDLEVCLQLFIILCSSSFSVFFTYHLLIAHCGYHAYHHLVHK